jgi:cell filamentation protein
MPEDPYADPATGVLRNKLGLSATGELENAEREMTHAALIFLKESPVQPSYDLRHLCAIHRRVFGDIYDWAGQLRTVAIAKGTWFCLPQYIESAAAEVFRALHGESLLRGLPREVFTERLAHSFGEVNAIHPFRQGNGRAQRAFFEQLSSDAGFILDWQHLDADRNIASSAAIEIGAGGHELDGALHWLRSAPDPAAFDTGTCPRRQHGERVPAGNTRPAVNSD